MRCGGGGAAGQTGLTSRCWVGKDLYLCGERKRERIAFQMVEVMGTVSVKHETYISENRRSTVCIMKYDEVRSWFQEGLVGRSAGQSSTELFPAIGRCERSLLF